MSWVAIPVGVTPVKPAIATSSSPA
jgi:hypothetical protein